MTDSLRILLGRLVDYAGLFPPAKLDMPTTVRNYADYLASPEAWMLGRLIVPVAQLDAFEQHAATLLPGQDDDLDAWAISAITAPAGEAQLEADLDRIAAFNDRHEDPANGFAMIDVIELKADTPNAAEHALDLIPDELFPFFEIPISSDPRGLIATLVGSEAGAKVRTGGITPDLYPQADHLARFIHACANAGVAFKATAGMHHPLRRVNPAVGVKEYGFLNVFAAACLAEKHELDQAMIRAILEEEAIGAFTFGDDSLAWRTYALGLDEIEDVREVFAVSFGSCSFDEPRDDLRSLGLL